MKIVLLLAVVCAANASVLQFLHTPSEVYLPKSADLRSNDVPVVTSQLIGLSAEVPPGWTGHGDLLSRPKAAAIIVLSTPDHFKPQLTGNSYTLTQTAQGLNLKSLEFDFKTSFDDGVVLVDSSATKLETTNTAVLEDMNVDGLVKTKITPLRQELENVYRIALWLEKEGSRLSKRGSPDLYVVRISGLTAALTSAGPSDPESQAALEEVTKAIEKLSAALQAAYGDQVIVEMVTQTAESQDHIIVRRQAREDPVPGTNVMNVYGFTNNNYPAAFAIVAGVAIFFAIIVLFIGVGMWNMDPGKDSIIYRMTTPRLKRE